jgi:uncharacterized membrane-anchored protein YitT (DUF2179 family)
MDGGPGGGEPPLPGTRHAGYEDAQSLFVGTVLAATGLAILQHLGLVTGQIAGLALLATHWTGFGFGPVFFVLNLPFYLLALRRMGRPFVVKTVIAVGLFSLLVWAQPMLLTFADIQPLAGAILAGILSGTGLLVLFRHRASLGGIGIMAVWLQERTGFRAGWTQMTVDAVVFSLAALTLPPMAVLYSLVGAVALNLVIAINHRADRYIGM